MKNVSRETFWWYNNQRGNKMVKKALKYILLITLAAIIFFYGYSKFEDKKEWTDFVNEISLSEAYDEERLEDYFNYHKIHPSFETERIIAEVNEKDERILYYDSFIDLIKQPNRTECLKYFFKNKGVSINDVIVLSNKQLLDMAYDDVLAKYLHLNMDGAAIRECVDYSKKNSKAQTEDVMVLKEKQLLDMMFDDVLAKYLHLDIDGTTIRKCVEYSKKHRDIEADDVVLIINLELEDIEPTKMFLDLISADFFMPTRLERYMKIYQENTSYTPRQVVEIVNCDADRPFYTNVEPADLSKGFLIIVNKFYYLEKDYVPENLVVVSKEYSSYGARLEKTVYEAFVEMCEAAKESLLQIVVRADDGYRSYDYQSEVYNYYKNAYGTKGADNCSARAGFSEHQSGLTVDIEVYPLEGNNTYTNQGRYEWTMENCWYYGFINRYQEGKEHLTGYQQEEWHYRYVGKEVALFIKEHNITFDEYYTYFVKGY